MIISIASIILGFVLLIKGSDVLVSGSSTLARRLGIPTLVVGLTVVAFGTSAPELFVNVTAALSGATDIAIGNIFGSNIANILLILGCASLIAPLKLKSQTVWKEIPFSLLGAVLVVILGADVVLDGGVTNVLSRIDGLVLFGFFIIFLVYTFGIRDTSEKLSVPEEMIPLPKALIYIVAGLIGLVAGGQLVVSGASAIALILGVSQNLIALTIVAIGTSLPELVSSIIAVRKGQQDLAIGNVVGSNVFNIFLVLGATSTVSPLTFSSANMTDGVVAVVATLLMFVFLFVGKRHTLYRFEGAMFLLFYLVFLVFVVVRG